MARGRKFQFAALRLIFVVFYSLSSIDRYGYSSVTRSPSALLVCCMFVYILPWFRFYAIFLCVNNNWVSLDLVARDKKCRLRFSWQGRAAIIGYNILVVIAFDRVFFSYVLSSEIHIIFGNTIVIIEQSLMVCIYFGNLF